MQKNTAGAAGHVFLFFVIWAIFTAVLFGLLAMAASASPPAASSAHAAAAKYPPAVWMQPASSFAKWKARGVPSLFGIPLDAGRPELAAEGITAAAWCDAADAAGMNYTLQYTATTAPLVSRPGCAAVMMTPDEPNGSGDRTPGQCADEAAAIRLVTDKPIVIQLDGAAIRWQSDAQLKAYCAAAGANSIISFDFYPLQRGEGPAAIPQIGQVLARVKAAAPGRPVIVAIDTGPQHLGDSEWGKAVDPTGQLMRGPTVDEWSQELEQAAPAAGILYFPDDIGQGWRSFDATAPPIAAAMPAVNRLLTPPPATAPPAAPITPPAATCSPSFIEFDNGRRYRLTPAN